MGIFRRRVRKSQKQESGDESVSIQAARDVNVGLSGKELVQFVRELYLMNSYELKEEARKVAVGRVDCLLEDFAVRLATLESHVASLSDPDVQFGLISAQIDYARSGEEYLRKILVDLLVARCDRRATSFQAIVLSEAISTVRKLTKRNINELTLVWLLTRVSDSDIDSIESLTEWMRKYIAPLMKEISVAPAEFLHLEYAGCVAISTRTPRTLAELLISNYYGLFQREFQVNEISEAFFETLDEAGLIRRNADAGFRLTIVHVKDIREIMSKHHFSDNDEISLTNLLNQHAMNSDEVEQLLRNYGSPWPELYDHWRDTMASNIRVSSVGIAIAHSCISKKEITKEDPLLSIWINEDSVQER